jgi:ADP-ribosylation factor GTPase-activating protein 1
MDKWKDTELAKMKVGGNQLAREFFEDEEPNWDTMSIQQKYNSKAAALYRDKISTLADNKEWDYEEAKVKLNKSSNHHSFPQSKSTSALSNSYQQDSYQDSSYQQVNTQEFKDQRDNFFNTLQSANASRPNHIPPNQGGKYTGFGNTAQAPPTRSQSEVFDTTLSSLSSGWNLLSFGASKVKDNALKFGSIATQKVVEVSQNVSEKVHLILSLFWFPFIIFYFYVSGERGWFTRNCQQRSL